MEQSAKAHSAGADPTARLEVMALKHRPASMLQCAAARKGLE